LDVAEEEEAIAVATKGAEIDASDAEEDESDDSDESESFMESESDAETDSDSEYYNKNRDPQYSTVRLPRVSARLPPDTPTNKPAPKSHADIRESERQNIAAANQPFPVHAQPKWRDPIMPASTHAAVHVEAIDAGTVNWVRDRSQIPNHRNLKLGKLKNKTKAVAADRRV